MSVALYGYPSRPPPMKRRRTATTVLAGNFDPRPPRDVLTSLLNGVGPYKPVEGDEEDRRVRRLERKKREKEKKRLKKQHARAEQADGTRRQVSIGAGAVSAGPSTATTVHGIGAPTVNSSTSSFWRIRGPAVAPTRSVSPTPPPELSSPPTPGPSISSTMSFGSSKRPRTPEDGRSLLDHAFESSSPPPQPKPRKKRIASRKGWKGWVEGSPPPSNKLINLDEAPVMVERRLRSGKNFDAISEGKDTWVTPSPYSS
ncbi:uncharacterized protein FOMMEDRAFT_23222 [Fomitiporia mediterranea MF3/22]|uniref:uncharacterized protein n=1 Tax=Fomitiporia mediterranea (strain MF3/22) TaxID=694068 RepID=UPI0004407A63|nr:uncharacterized protein FOMMEDRAFT_23222 [Fomitiporia mediterranea MF3/22]EJC99364.1 hypothetical protein FOMMEDRAFT_23222 [Fomitiporia mediterranea MF3/22]